MAFYQGHRHSLLEEQEEFKHKEEWENTSNIKIENRITLTTFFLFLIAIFSGWFIVGIEDDPNGMVAFAIVPIGILYFLGLITSGILFWYSYGEKLHTKVITLINAIIYVGILIFCFL